MYVILTKTITVFTYDHSTLILRAGTHLFVDVHNGIALSPDGYHFDILPHEYSISN